MKRMAKHLLTTTALLAVAAATTHCERRPLVDISQTHYVRVYVDENLKNVTTGFYDPTLHKPNYSSPDVLRVVLYDPTSGKVAAERYLRNRDSDDRGTFYDGYVSAPPGNYQLMTYNFGTESTLIRNDHLFEGAEAYTEEISDYLRSQLSSRADPAERIVYVPDHLFVDQHETLQIPVSQQVDTLYNAQDDHFTAGSIVKSYYLQIRVKGAKMISTATGLLTGMAGSAGLNDGAIREDDPVTVYFEMEPGNTISEDEAYIYTTFHTFGKLPDQSNELSITFDIKTTDGRSLTATLDITDKFSEPEAIEQQWLLLDQVLNIPEIDGSEGGGFVPGVDDWEDIETDIII